MGEALAASILAMSLINFQYPQLGSLWVKRRAADEYAALVWTFSILSSDRCG